jgi:hypothetical protein
MRDQEIVAILGRISEEFHRRERAGNEAQSLTAQAVYERLKEAKEGLESARMLLAEATELMELTGLAKKEE